MACALLAACGKKGPPLAPISHIPAAVALPSVERVGDDMYVSLKVPTKNIDGSMPADVARIDVFGVTALTTPSPTQVLQSGTRVASVPVAKPPLKGEAPPATNEPMQGGVVSIHDALRPADLTPVTLVEPPTFTRRPARGTPPPVAVPPVVPDEEPVPQRFYMVLPFSERGRPGPPGMLASVPLMPLPDPPANLEATYTADTLTLTWEAAAPPQPGVAVPPALVTSYNVYRRVSPDPLDLPAPPTPAWAAQRPAPASPAPLAAPPFTEPTDFDRQTCYVVRAVRGTGPTALESVPSEPTCVTPVDTFPPAAPKSLSAVAAEGSIGLIWEPNSEPDLDGYLVLRGEAGGATLQPLTATPIAEAQFTDRTVQSGVRYVYAVVAVDNRVPVPNASAESNRVEETAR